MDQVKNAIRDAWQWVQNLAGMLAVILGGALSFIQPLLDRLTIALGAIKDAAFWVKDQIDQLAGALRNIDLDIPDWLRPGSPTPFELGLKGISSALRDVEGSMAGFEFGQLNRQNQANNQMQGTGGISNFILNLQSGFQNENVIADFETMKAWSGRM